MIRREVVQEKVVHVAGGRQYRLRRGDIVALFPLLSPQMDPEIHQEPQVATVLRDATSTPPFIVMKVAGSIPSGVSCCV